MSILKFSARVTHADGELFSYDAHERNVSGEALGVFTAALQDIANESRALHHKHKEDDDENLTVVLESSLDGVAYAPITETGVSYRTVVEVQRYHLKHVEKLMKISEDKAQKKHEKKHGKK